MHWSPFSECGVYKKLQSNRGIEMARKRNVIGEGFGKDILSRSGDLRKRAASHGDVFSGELADEALDAVGARAMMMNGEIIVNSNFDLSNAEDQALYAHELYHQSRSGGAAGDKIRDAEEIAARAIESMVFHQAGGGRSDALPTNIEDLFQQAESPATPSATEGETTNTVSESKENGEPSAILGYEALRKQGMTHGEIVYMLAQMMIDQNDQSQDFSRQRGGGQRGFSQ
jgi:hypothetical protein